MGNTNSRTNKFFFHKVPRVSQYCKNKHGEKAYYDYNACRKNGKIIEKISLQKFENFSNNITKKTRKKKVFKKNKSNKNNL
jgi:hypothetical protein